MGGALAIKVRYVCVSSGIRSLRGLILSWQYVLVGKFYLGIRLSVNFDKNCVPFHKRVHVSKKCVNYLKNPIFALLISKKHCVALILLN